MTAGPTPLSQGAHCPLFPCHGSLTTHVCPDPPATYPASLPPPPARLLEYSKHRLPPQHWLAVIGYYWWVVFAGHVSVDHTRCFGLFSGLDSFTELTSPRFWNVFLWTVRHEESTPAPATLSFRTHRVPPRYLPLPARVTGGRKVSCKAAHCIPNRGRAPVSERP